MSEKNVGSIHHSTYRVAGSEERRILAVSAALELIAQRATVVTTSGFMEEELSNLSSYADKIQDALKLK